MLHRHKSLLLCFALLACQHQTPTGPNNFSTEPQWAMYGGNVRHTGNLNTPAYDGIVGPTDSTTIHTRWATITNEFVGMYAGGIQAPLVADDDGTIYVTTNKGLIAVNADGSLKWLFDEGGKSSVALGVDATVFYHSWTGHLYAFASDGRRILEKAYCITDPNRILCIKRPG